MIFLGRRNDAYRYYQAMDLFLLPSRYEGLPVVGVEAQAAGLPCIFSTEVTSETKILDSTIFISSIVNVEEWANKVINLGKTERKNKQEELQTAGFDIKVEAKKLEGMYFDLLNNEKVRM